MVIGNMYNVSISLFSPGTTIPAKVASEFVESGGLSRASLIELVLVLLVITLLMNVIARLLVWRVTRGKTVKE
jgi:phosphate transport system permease protein